MTTIDDATIVRLATDQWPARERIEVLREIYGRTIIKHDIEPLHGAGLWLDGTLRALPGLGFAAISCSGFRARRGRHHIDSDNLILNVTLSGSRMLRQRGRDAVVSAGEAVLVTSREAGETTVATPTRYISFSVPRLALAPLIEDPDAHLVRPIPRDNEALRLLVGYAQVLRDTQPSATPQLARTVARHVHDLIAIVLGATRDAAEAAKGRGLRAARLRAVKADIDNHLDTDLSLDKVAARQRVSPRYVQMLFESEGVTFTKYVLGQRLARAHRMLSDARFNGRSITSIAFEVGFDNLSYFNRCFRRRFGATPSEVRAASAHRHDVSAAASA